MNRELEMEYVKWFLNDKLKSSVKITNIIIHDHLLRPDKIEVEFYYRPIMTTKNQERHRNLTKTSTFFIDKSDIRDFTLNKLDINE
jgi:hypothetical protein